MPSKWQLGKYGESTLSFGRRLQLHRSSHELAAYMEQTWPFQWPHCCCRRTRYSVASVGVGDRQVCKCPPRDCFVRVTTYFWHWRRCSGWMRMQGTTMADAVFMGMGLGAGRSHCRKSPCTAPRLVMVFLDPVRTGRRWYRLLGADLHLCVQVLTSSGRPEFASKVRPSEDTEATASSAQSLSCIINKFNSAFHPGSIDARPAAVILVLVLVLVLVFLFGLFQVEEELTSYTDTNLPVGSYDWNPIGNMTVFPVKWHGAWSVKTDTDWFVRPL